MSYKQYVFKIVYNDGISEERMLPAISNIQAWERITLYALTKSFREKIDVVGINLLNNGRNSNA